MKKSVLDDNAHIRDPDQDVFDGNLFRALLAPSIALLFVACVKQRPSPAITEGTLVEVRDNQNIDVTSSSGLFAAARDAEENDDDQSARNYYGALLKHFPRSSYAFSAGYNLGMLHERASRFSEALERYDHLLEVFDDFAADTEDYVDTQFRRAVCLSKLDKPWYAVAAFDAVLDIEKLDAFDRLQAYVGRGMALEEADDPIGAEMAYGHALRFYRIESKVERIEDMGLVAEAAYRMGMIAQREYDAVELHFPVEALREKLESKCTFLLSAQARFLRAIRYGDRHTAAAAGFQIGRLYETLYDTVVELEVPAELDEEQSVIYQEEVRDRVDVLIRKAVMVYEKSLAVSRGTQSAQTWIEQLEAALTRLRTLYADAG